MSPTAPRRRALALSLTLAAALSPAASRAEPPAVYDEIPPSLSLLIYSPCKALPLSQAPAPLSATPPPDPVITFAAKLSEADLNTLTDFESFAVTSIAGRPRIIAGTSERIEAFDLSPNNALIPSPDLALDLSAISRDRAVDPALALMDLRAAPSPSPLVFGLYVSSNDDTTTLLAWDATTGRQASVTRIREPYASVAWISPSGDAAFLMRTLYDDQPLALLDLFSTTSRHRLNRLLFAHDPDRDLPSPQLLLSPDRRQLWAITQPSPPADNASPDASPDALPSAPPFALHVCALPPP